MADLVVHNMGDVCVVRLGNRSLVEGIEIENLGRKLYELVDAQAQRKLLLDFSAVKNISSSLLGVLVKLQKKSSAIKGQVVLVGMKPELRKIFAITKLDKLFAFGDTEEKGLDLLSLHAP